MAENKFYVFGEKINKADTLTDEEYLDDVTRKGGNLIGIALRAPNNKALKQATLGSAALAGYIARDNDTVESINDEIEAEALTEALANKVDNTIEKAIIESPHIVHTTNNETVAGVKSFNDLPELASDPALPQQSARKQYVDTQDQAMLKASKDYADLAIGNLSQAGKDYIDTAIEDALSEAKDYVDGVIADGGGGGTGGAVLAPDIISPANGAIDVLISTDFVAGPFRSAYTDNVRTSRQFQITEDNWDNCVVDTEINSDRLILNEPLKANSDYKWRCRDKSSYGITSSWSEEAAFDTGGELMVIAPTLTISGGNLDVPETPQFASSAFVVNQGMDTHVSTDWRVVLASDKSVVWSSLNDTVNLTSITMPAGFLKTITQYEVQVRYKGLAYNYSKWSEPLNFTTRAQFTHVQTPVLSVVGGTVNVGKTPTIMGTAFTIEPEGTDTHVSTTWQVFAQGGGEQYKLANSTTQKTSFTIPDNILREAQSYIVYATYHSQTYGDSARGMVSFTCAEHFSGVVTPAISVMETEPNAVTMNSIFVGTEYEDYDNAGAVLDVIDWVLYKDGVEVWARRNSLPFTKLYSFSGYALIPLTDYVIKVRYKNKPTGKWSSWGELAFRTAEDLGYPTIKFKMKDSINLGNICLWFDTEQLKVYKNGIYDNGLTLGYESDQPLSAAGDIIEIKNEVDPNNYPFVHFANNANLLTIETPFPKLKQTNLGNAVTDFGGDVGDDTGKFEPKDTETNGGRNGQDKYGMFANCSNLTSVANYLFRFNEQIINLGGMGGGAGGGNNDLVYNGGDGAGGKGAGLGAGKGTGKGRGGAGGHGYGAFYNCINLRNIPPNLLAGLVNLENMGGFGGGAGGGNGSSGSRGGDGYGCFSYSGIEYVPDNFCADLVKLYNVGGYGGGGANYTNMSSLDTGGDGYGCWSFCENLVAISDKAFDGAISLINISGYGGGAADAETPYPSDGGKGYGCFSYSALRNLPTGLFKALSQLKNTGGYSGAKWGVGYPQGGGAGYYGGGAGYSGNGLNDDNGGRGFGGGAGGGTQDTTPQPRLATSVGCFEGCSNLTFAPNDLLSPLINLEFVIGFFRGCGLLSVDFIITSPILAQASYFAADTANKGTVTVPSSSLTATTFKGDVTANVNVIEE